MAKEERDAVDDLIDEFYEEVRKMDAAEGREADTPTAANTVIVALSKLVTLEAEFGDLMERVEVLERNA